MLADLGVYLLTALYMAGLLLLWLAGLIGLTMLVSWLFWRVWSRLR